MIGKIAAYRIFCAEMAGINEVQATFLGIPKLVVFHIGGNKGIAAGVKGIVQITATSTAADGDLADLFAAVAIPQTAAVELFLDSGKKCA